MIRRLVEPRFLLVSVGVMAGLVGGGLGAPAGALMPAPTTPAPEGSSPVDAFQRDLIRVSRRASLSIITIVAQLDPQGPEPSALAPGDTPRQRVGSGILVDSSGSIITTCSNIKGAYALFLRTAAGQMLPATLVGADRATNIALLQVRNAPGQPARLGESGLVSAGAPVLVAGGAQPSVPMSSFGAVEVDGGLFVRYSELELFRTNTPLFPGSIGGAVFSMDGRVVGMVAGSLTSATTTSAGLSGFIYGDRLISAHCSNPTLVVPIERAQEIAAELRAYGRVMRGFLGIAMQTTIDPPTPGPGQRGRLGVTVGRVQPGGPADVAGLRPGDRIISYSGSEVRVPDELTFLITSTRPGSEIPVSFERTGQVYQVTVVIGISPEPLITLLGHPGPHSSVPDSRSLDAPRPAVRFEPQRHGDTPGAPVSGEAPARSLMRAPAPAAARDSTRPGGH